MSVSEVVSMSIFRRVRDERDAAKAEIERLQAQVQVALKRAEKRGLHTDVVAIQRAYQLAQVRQ